VNEHNVADERARLAPTHGVIAFAPGSIGNLGPGLDVLGCAVTGAGDEVHAWWTDDASGVTVVDAGHPDIPTSALRNACAIAAQAVLDRVSASDAIRERGLMLSVRKGLPLSGGQGGSGASAVAAAVAVNQLIVQSGGDALDRAGLLDASLVAEASVAGRHLDNLAASLMGGVICILGIDPPDVTNVPVKVPLWFALAHPAISVRTADSRAVLPASVSRATLIAQLASVASLVTGIANGDLELVGRALVDHVAEPPRAALIPGFADAKFAALEAGALGASISGSGPTTFAACVTEAQAMGVAEAMRWSYERTGHVCASRVCTIDFEGARWRYA